MHQRGLGIAKAHGAVSRQTEVGVLINGARNQAGDFGRLLLIVTKDVGEGCGEGCGTLNAREVNLADV